MVNQIYLIHSMGMDEMPADLITKQDLICVDILFGCETWAWFKDTVRSANLSSKVD